MKYSLIEYFKLIFNLRKHQKLAAKRHPAFQQNKIGKFFIYFMGMFVILYLMFIAVMLSLIANGTNSFTPIGFIFSILPFILIIDFLFRFTAQQTPSQLVKPYILLPVPINACIDSFIFNSIFNSGNLIWFALFLPFSIMSVIFAEGLTTTITLNFVLFLIISINSQWYSIVRSLVNKNVLWWLLPVIIYGLLFLPVYYNLKIDFENLLDFYASFGENLFTPNLLNWLILALISVFALTFNRFIQIKSIWRELAHVEQTKLTKVTKLSFLERYGIIGEYLKLEIKSIMRNKNVKKSLIFSSSFVLIISMLVAFTDIYDNQFWNFFWIVYCYCVYGMLNLSRSMCAEGNYIDGLLVHKENLLSLISAKYYLSNILLILPFIFLLPPVIMGKYSFLMLVSMLFFTAGVQHFMFLQLSVYNKQTIPLNTKFIGKGSMETNYIQVVINFAAFIIPVALLYVFYFLFNETIAYLILFIIGIIFVATHRMWISNIYKRMMVRRYINLEGFRATRDF